MQFVNLSNVAKRQIGSMLYDREQLVAVLASLGASSGAVANILQLLSPGAAQPSIRTIRRVAARHGVAFPSFNTEQHGSPLPDAVLDGFVRAHAQAHGANYGYRYVRAQLLAHMPAGFTASRRRVLRAMRRLSAGAVALRLTQWTRGRARTGHIRASHYGDLAQSDLNCVLEQWGLVIAIVIDVKTRTIMQLNAQQVGEHRRWPAAVRPRAAARGGG